MTRPATDSVSALGLAVFLSSCGGTVGHGFELGPRSFDPGREVSIRFPSTTNTELEIALCFDFDGLVVDGMTSADVSRSQIDGPPIFEVDFITDDGHTVASESVVLSGNSFCPFAWEDGTPALRGARVRVHRGVTARRVYFWTRTPA